MIGAIGLVSWPVITGINAIISAAGALGAVFTTISGGVIAAIGAITWPVVAVAAAVVAGALLIRKYWEPVSAFFAGVVEGLMSAFAPVGEMFAPLAPIFDGLGEKLRGVWQWFKDLIAPVKATQDTLNSCRDVGVMFGQTLADALLMPLNAFNKLRSGIDWVLENSALSTKNPAHLTRLRRKPMQRRRTVTARQSAHTTAISRSRHPPVKPTSTRVGQSIKSPCRAMVCREIGWVMICRMH